MSDFAVQPIAEPVPPPAPGLTQWQRVVYIFTSPSKTFEDIKAGHKSWWLPFLLSILVAYAYFGVLYSKIGIDQITQNQIHQNAKQEQQLQDAPADRRAATEKIITYSTEGAFLASPVLVLIAAAIIALGLWGTINFGFGGKATFGGIFAVYFFATLPALFKPVLGAIVAFFGAPESFNLKNPAPTNIAAFLSPTDTNAGLYSLLSSIDIITIWTLVLLSIGTAIVAGTKRSSGFIAVFGWWIVFTLAGVGIAAAFGGH